VLLTEIETFKQREVDEIAIKDIQRFWPYSKRLPFGTPDLIFSCWMGKLTSTAWTNN